MIRALLLATLLLLAAATRAEEPDLILTGSFDGKTDNHTYHELPFTVPAGVGKLTIDVSWEGAEQGTFLVLGLYDPERLRGWGGLNKPHFVVAESFATPAYLPGPIRPGRWKLSVAVANIRPDVTSPYKVKISFGRGPAAQRFADQPVKDGPGWYRGDLHTHTGHSDGACRSQSDKPVPCPVFLTLKAAAEHRLDFIAVTDHNTSTQLDGMAELASYFDKMLVIPGREMTTQYGHYNLIGIADFVEFRLGSKNAPDINAMFDASRASGALISINHPEIPTGENCLGCGWSAPGTDYGKVGAIEVANGGIASELGDFDDGPASGTAFWEARLNEGHHLTAVGGSDNHDAVNGKRDSSPVGAQSPVGVPATVVYAQSLSQPAILEGLRSGRVFVDLEGADPKRLLDLSARSGAAEAVMGGILRRADGQPIEASLHLAGLEPMARAELIVDGRKSRLLDDKALTDGDQTVDFKLPADQTVHWFRIDVRTHQGRRIMIGNPIYVAAAGS